MVDAVTMGWGKALWWQKEPESGRCCHHWLQKGLAVTERTRKWSLLSPLAASGSRGDREDQKVVAAVTIGCALPRGDRKDQKVVDAGL